MAADQSFAPPETPLSTDAAVRFLVAGYGAILLASVGAVAVVATEGVLAGWPELLGTIAVAGVAGAAVGWTVATRVDGWWPRLGRSWRGRWTPTLIAAPFVALALAATFGVGDPALATPAWIAAAAVAAAGPLLAAVCRNRHVVTVVRGAPRARSRWEPSGSRRLDLLLVALGALLAVSNAVTADWAFSAIWTVFAASWLAASVDAGRLGSRTDGDPELLVYENGIVRRRRFTARFVPWEDVAHARLREGELVVDRGLFDLRVDAESLADPEGLFAAIEDAGPTTIQ